MLEIDDKIFVISVVVCTYNREKYIAKCIDSLLKQSLSRDLYEIIVVDNGSTDQTPAIVARYSGEGVRYCRETRMGLSYARNRGCSESRSGLIAYIDDDACACSVWLEKIINIFGSDDSIAAVGGPIFPEFEIDRPKWLTDDLLTYYSCINWGKKRFKLSKGRHLYGCNMSIRREIITSCGGFPTRMGRIGSNLLSNEEWPIFSCIDRRGLSSVYDPEVCVSHTVLKERMTWGWLRSRLYWQGVSNLYSDYFVQNMSKYGLLAKYSMEIYRFYVKEVGLVLFGKKRATFLRLFTFRYIGTVLHYVKIVCGLVRRERLER
jgi:glycosyltransferase involved in cell wall biosynthesis